MSKRTRRIPPNAKGRDSNRSGRAERVLILRRSLVLSPVYSVLSLASRQLLVEMLAMFNGTNREHVFLSVRDAADRLGFACLKATMNAFDELKNAGFITETVSSTFSMKADVKSRARGWRLNWIDSSGRCVDPGKLPALDFSLLTKTQRNRVKRRSDVLSRYIKDYSAAKYAVDESSTMSARRQFAVENFSTQERKNGAKWTVACNQDSSTHLDNHRVGDLSLITLRMDRAPISHEDRSNLRTVAESTQQLDLTSLRRSLKVACRRDLVC